MVTNNSFFVDSSPSTECERHLEDDYTAIYHVDLHGNVRHNPKLSGTTHNVFGIQVGVGITLAVRKALPANGDESSTTASRRTGAKKGSLPGLLRPEP